MSPSPGYPFARQKHWVDPRISTEQQDLPIAAASVIPSASTNGSHATTGGAVSRQQQIEATLQRIWAQSLGIDSIDPNADFFELGGDSVTAIGIANNLAKEGLDLSPQDLFEHHTIAGLATVVAERYGAGGLGGSFTDAENPPIPPNISYFLERGLREAGRWCVPLILRLGPEVSVDDVRAVLTAVVNHHDALRLQIVEHAGTWEQQLPGTAGVHRAVYPVAARRCGGGVLPNGRRCWPFSRSSSPARMPPTHRCPRYTSKALKAVRTTWRSPCTTWPVTTYRARSVVTDIFTAFSQRLAGQDIALQPVTHDVAGMVGAMRRARHPPRRAGKP